VANFLDHPEKQLVINKSNSTSLTKLFNNEKSGNVLARMEDISSNMCQNKPDFSEPLTSSRGKQVMKSMRALDPERTKLNAFYWNSAYSCTSVRGIM